MRPNLDDKKPNMKNAVSLRNTYKKPLDVSGIIRKCMDASQQVKKVEQTKTYPDRMAESFKLNLRPVTEKDSSHLGAPTSPGRLKKLGHSTFGESIVSKMFNKKPKVPTMYRVTLDEKRILTSQTKTNRTSVKNSVSNLSMNMYKTPEDAKTKLGTKATLMPEIKEEPVGKLTEKKERFYNEYLKYNKFGGKEHLNRVDPSGSKNQSDSEQLYASKNYIQTSIKKCSKEHQHTSLTNRVENKVMSLGVNRSGLRNNSKEASLYGEKVEVNEFSKRLLMRNMKELEDGGNLYDKKKKQTGLKSHSQTKTSILGEARIKEITSLALGMHYKPNKTSVDRLNPNNSSVYQNKSRSKRGNISSFIDKTKQNALKNFGVLKSTPRENPISSTKREPRSMKKSETRKKLLSEDPEKRLSLERKLSSRGEPDKHSSDIDSRNLGKLNNINIVTITSDNLRNIDGNPLVSNNLSSKLSAEDIRQVKKLSVRPDDFVFNLNDSTPSIHNIRSIMNSRNSKGGDVLNSRPQESVDMDNTNMAHSRSQSAHTFDSNKTKALRLSKDMVSLRADLIKKIKQSVAETRSVPPTSLDYYHISRLLGEGSYGKVYLGNSLLASTPVAVKCYDKSRIKSDSNFKRILQEIEIMKELSHPNVVRLYEIFENKKFIFSVLEYVDNCDLLTHLKEHGIFTEEAFLPLFKQLIQALNCLQTHRVLHRDIKLDNILLTKDGQAKICDFGVSQKMPVSELVFDHIGTPAYMAPEIVLKKGYSGFKADIWSLGVTSVIALTGHVPFKGESIEELNHKILYKDVEIDDLCKVSDKLKLVLKGMLAKNPADRFDLQAIAGLLGFELEKPGEKQRVDDVVGVDKITRLGYTKEQIMETLKEKKINHIYALHRLFSK